MTEPSMQTTPKSVLSVLKADRLIAVGRDLEIAVDVDARKGKDQIAQRLLAGGLDLSRLVRVLGRDELREACRAHGIADDSRSRAELAERLMLAAAVDVIAPAPRTRALRPRVGDVVAVRQRQYLVEQVDAGERGVVHLVCLDDDAQGRRLQVLWELELGARVLVPEAVNLKGADTTDDPRRFSAYYHALKWSCVSATDAKLFQSPFRAGIKLMNHQLTALKKALELPRVNLFIADDVGLGKTIEAGLVLQELILRQRVDFVVIVCPASVLLQWRAEMDKRFGLGFEIYNRAFVQRRRQERGFSANPWDTHHRFIISYQTLRRPEYKDPLLQSLRERGKKSLLILDEAHTAAPSSSSIYGLDSKITDVIRHVAPQFENRLFLSATPHNGHSNSFSSLLEILDEKRFTRGVPVDTADLAPVMVRRLKEDLRQLQQGDFPKRRVGAVLLEQAGAGGLSATIRFDDGKKDPLGTVTAGVVDGEPVELRLAKLLAEYTGLMRPERGPGRLVFINLQKRLLSSLDAFFRTLRKHADGVGKGSATALMGRLAPSASDDELPFGEDDADVEAREGEVTLAGSASLPSPQGRAKALLEEMLELAGRHRSAPDGKTRALLAWLRQHILSDSLKVMGFDATLLKDTLDTALALSGFGPLSPGDDVDEGLGTMQRKLPTWQVPALSSGWDRTLDTMRPLRERDEDFWQWRKRPPLPVVFSPPERLRSDVVHLHLAHPFVQRLLSRFLAQGFSAQDLSRVTVVRNPHDDVARVVVLGRLILFGPGALRLHDELIGVAAEWNESRTGSHLKPFSVDDDRRALHQLESILHASQTGHAQPVPDAVRHRLAASAEHDLKTLWPHVDAEADARAHDAEQKLSARGVVEAEQLTRILKNQQAVILKQLKNQLALPFDMAGPATAEERRAAQKQWDGERTSMEARLQAIEQELVTEPVRQAQGYVTALRRVVPVGVVYLWPETR